MHKWPDMPPSPPGLYRFEKSVEGVRGFAAVGDRELKHFHEQGFLIIQEAFGPQEVQPAIEGLLDLIGGRNPAYGEVLFESGAPDEAASLSREEKQDYVRKLFHFVNFDARLKAVSEHPSLLALLTRLMGEQPVMFQDMALMKPPKIGAEKPWHQDNAYFELPLDRLVVGVWIALDAATPQNGCMHLIPGSHRKGPALHFQRRDWQICDTDVDVSHAVMAPLGFGGCLLFHGLMQHGTPPNTSPTRRRALQFHYKPASCPAITKEERMAVFGGEGKNVAC